MNYTRTVITDCNIKDDFYQFLKEEKNIHYNDEALPKIVEELI